MLEGAIQTLTFTSSSLKVSGEDITSAISAAPPSLRSWAHRESRRGRSGGSPGLASQHAEVRAPQECHLASMLLFVTTSLPEVQTFELRTPDSKGRGGSPEGLATLMFSKCLVGLANTSAAL